MWHSSYPAHLVPLKMKHYTFGVWFFRNSYLHTHNRIVCLKVFDYYGVYVICEHKCYYGRQIWRFPIDPEPHCKCLLERHFYIDEDRNVTFNFK